MKKVLLSSALFLLLGKAGFCQSDGDLRSRISGGGYGSATTWQKYSTATGAWTTSDIVPTSSTNVLIRDGIIQTSNGSGYVAGTLTIGEGNAATATATITNGVVTGITITDPGKLIVVPGVTFVGYATTVATATVSSVNVTGTSFNDQGSGYTTATVTFAAAPAGGTTATGTAVITGGKITAITVTDPGSGYTSVPAITITGDGTGANYSSLVGVQSINITNGGAGYTAVPRVMLGSAFQVGNSSTTRSVTVSGDVVFKKGADMLTGGSSTTLTSTLVVGGDLRAETPVNFITQVPASTSSTTISFNKAGTAIVSGAPFTFRAVTVGASTTVQVNSTMNIAGTVTLNSTGMIDASNGTIGYVTFNPTNVTQTIANSTFKDGLVRNLLIRNVAGVNLNQNLTITNLLTLDSGLVNIPTTGTLQITATNPIGGTYGSSAYLNTLSDAATGALGVVQLNNITPSTSRTIPLGNGGNYLPVTINPTTTSTFTTSVFTGATDDGTPNGTPTANKTNIVDATYIVNRTAGTGNATLTLGFPSSLKGSGFASITNNQLGTQRFNGTSWDNPTGSGDNTLNFATATYSNFSPFRVAVNTGAALPVKLGDITATKANGQVQVKWTVYTETNIDRYIVEKSTDGVTFFAAGVVSAQAKSVYTYNDNTPSFGRNLYRIKAVEKDNSYALSKVALVDLAGVSAARISPNPINQGFFTIALSNFRQGKVQVKLYSNAGQLVVDKIVDNNGSNDSQLIYLPSTITKGNYHIVVSDGSNIQNASVIIK